uniref:Proline rich 12 n=1 Tax=Tetraodon nigroviridis TaxID=99883 RepID=H3DCK4_TETNG
MNLISALESRGPQPPPSASSLLSQFRTPSWQTAMHTPAPPELFISGALPGSGSFPSSSALSAYQHPASFSSRSFPAASLSLQDTPTFSPTSNGLLSPHDPLLHIKAPSQSSLGFDRLLSSQGAAAAAYRGSQDPTSATSAQASSARHLQSHQFNLLSSQLQDQSSQLYNASVFSSAQPQPQSQSQSNSAQERAVPRQDSVIKHYQRPTPAQSQLSSSAAHSLQHYLSCGGAGYQQIATHHRHAGLSCSPLGDQSPSSDHKPATRTEQYRPISQPPSGAHPSNSIPTSSSSAAPSRQQPPPPQAPPPPPAPQQQQPPVTSTSAPQSLPKSCLSGYGSPVPPVKTPTSALTGQTPTPTTDAVIFSPISPPLPTWLSPTGASAQDLSSGTTGKGYGSLGGRSQSYSTDIYGTDSAYGSLPSSLGGAGSPSLGYGAPGHSPALLRSSGSSGGGASAGGNNSGTGSGNSGSAGGAGNSMTNERGGSASGGGSYHIPDSSPSPSGNSAIIRPGLHSPVPTCPTQSPGGAGSNKYISSVLSPTFLSSPQGVGAQRSQEEVDDDDEFLIQHLLQAQASPAPQASHHHPQQQPQPTSQQAQPQPQSVPPSTDSGKGLSYDMSKTSEERYHPQSVIRTHSATATAGVGSAGAGGSISGLDNQLEMSLNQIPPHTQMELQKKPQDRAEIPFPRKTPEVQQQHSQAHQQHQKMEPRQHPQHHKIDSHSQHPQHHKMDSHPQQQHSLSQQQAVMEGAGGALGTSSQHPQVHSHHPHSHPHHIPPPSSSAHSQPQPDPQQALSSQLPPQQSTLDQQRSEQHQFDTVSPVEKAEQNQQNNRFVPLTSICFPDPLLQDEDRSFFPGMEDMFCAEDYKSSCAGGAGPGQEEMNESHAGQEGMDSMKAGQSGGGTGGSGGAGYDIMGHHGGDQGYESYCHGLEEPSNNTMTLDLDSLKTHELPSTVNTEQLGLIQSQAPAMGMGSNAAGPNNSGAKMSAGPGKKSYAQEYEFEDDEDKADQPADIRLNSRRLPDLLPDLVSSCRKGGSGSLSPLMSDIDFYHSSGYPMGSHAILPQRGVGEVGAVGAEAEEEGGRTFFFQIKLPIGTLSSSDALLRTDSLSGTDPALSDGSVGSAPSLGLSPGPPCSADSTRSQDKNKQKSQMGDEKDSESKAGFVASFLDFLKSEKRPPGLDISPGMDHDNGETSPCKSGGLRPLSPAPPPPPPPPPFGDSEGNGGLALGNCSSPKRLEDELKRNLETLPSFSSDEEDSVGKNQDLQKSISSAISALSPIQTPKTKTPNQLISSTLLTLKYNPTRPYNTTRDMRNKESPMPSPSPESPASPEEPLPPKITSLHLAQKQEDAAIAGESEEDESESGGEGIFRERDEFVVRVEDIRTLKLALQTGREPPPIWRVQKALLQKFSPEIKDGQRQFCATSNYLGYFGDAKKRYQRIYVKFLENVNKKDYVRVCSRRPWRRATPAVRYSRAKRQPLPKMASPPATQVPLKERPPKSKLAKVKAEPPPKKRKKWLKEIPSSSDSDSSESENETLSPAVPVKGGVNNRAMREMFRSYVEMLVSTALDPDMIQALEDTADELYLPPMRKIDSILSEQKRRLLRRVSMSSQHQEVLHAYPQIIVDPLDSGVVRVRLSGDAYNRKTLNRVKKSLPKPQDIKLSADSYRIYSLYHSLHHYKYHTFLQCKKEVSA